MRRKFKNFGGWDWKPKKKERKMQSIAAAAVAPFLSDLYKIE